MVEDVPRYHRFINAQGDVDIAVNRHPNMDLNAGMIRNKTGAEYLSEFGNPIRTMAYANYLRYLDPEDPDPDSLEGKLDRTYGPLDRGTQLRMPQPISDQPPMSQTFLEEQEVGGGGGTLHYAIQRLQMRRAREDAEDRAGLPPQQHDLNES